MVNQNILINHYPTMSWVGWFNTMSTFIGLFDVEFLYVAHNNNQMHYTSVMVNQTSLVNLYPTMS